MCTVNTITFLNASNVVGVGQWGAEQERGGTGGENRSGQQ